MGTKKYLKLTGLSLCLSASHATDYDPNTLKYILTNNNVLSLSPIAESGLRVLTESKVLNNLPVVKTEDSIKYATLLSVSIANKNSELKGLLNQNIASLRNGEIVPSDLFENLGQEISEKDLSDQLRIDIKALDCCGRTEIVTRQLDI